MTHALSARAPRNEEPQTSQVLQPRTQKATGEPAFVDMRPEVAVMRNQMAMVQHSPRAMQLKAQAAMMLSARSGAKPLAVAQTRRLGQQTMQRESEALSTDARDGLMPVSQLITGPQVTQCMYEDGENDIESILDFLLKSFENGDRALQISQLTELDDVAEEDMQKVLTWVRQSEELAAKPLLLALNTGNTDFANAILALIATPPKLEETPVEELIEDEPDFSEFEKLICQAVQFHAPRVGKLIDQAQKRAGKSGKKLLVIVGEGHDDPYSRVMVTILVGALQRLAANRLYIEATPDQVKEHVAPFKDKEPHAKGMDNIAHRQHFFHHLYQQDATVTGVDIYKETARKKAMEQLGTEPELESEKTEWKAQMSEETVAYRNAGIAKAVAAAAESGVMLVGLSHLPGLASDELIQSVYEIVTISTMLPEAVEFRDSIAYGRPLKTSAGLSKIKGLHQGGTKEHIKEVDPKLAYELAEGLIIKLNQI